MDVLRIWETYGPTSLFMALGIAKKCFSITESMFIETSWRKKGIMIIQGKLSRHFITRILFLKLKL